MMKFSKIFPIIFLFVFSCGPIKEIPVETQIVYNYVDSLRIKDSTVIIPIERIKDIVPVYDTLKMETSMAKSVSYVDTTTHSLKGSMENKEGVKYKYIYKDREIVRDSLIYKEVPVEKEVPVPYVPKVAKWCMWVVALELLLLALNFILKFKGMSLPGLIKGIFKK